jgi:hypothetical protein
MSEENTTVAEPADDATVVHDEAAEEKAHDELVADVTKMLDETPPDDKSEESAGDTGEGAKDDKPSEEAKPEDKKADGSAPAELSQDIQDRAEAAGISEELAKRLHQAGQLEETIAAFDRAMIERVQAQSADDTEDAPKDREPPKRQPPPEDGQEDAPAPDPKAYDENLWDEDTHKDLVKRDAYHKRRIDALEAQLAGLVQAQQAAFDKRFDEMVDGLGHRDLFGKGISVSKDKQTNRDTLFRAYQAVCEAYGADPNECDPEWGKRALSAMFPREVFKQAQRQTVDRLRDAEGKFLPASKAKGGPPPKAATEEEADAQLVSNVTAYLKEQGVQMSGV